VRRREHAPRERRARPRPRAAARERLELVLVEQPSGSSSSASTYASSPPGPTRRVALRAEQQPDRLARIVFPAPVSPVIAFSPRRARARPRG
jgi:hypothetical protein